MNDQVSCQKAWMPEKLIALLALGYSEVNFYPQPRFFMLHHIHQDELTSFQKCLLHKQISNCEPASFMTFFVHTFPLILAKYLCSVNYWVATRLSISSTTTFFFLPMLAALSMSKTTYEMRYDGWLYAWNRQWSVRVLVESIFTCLHSQNERFCYSHTQWLWAAGWVGKGVCCKWFFAFASNGVYGPAAPRNGLSRACMFARR